MIARTFGVLACAFLGACSGGGGDTLEPGPSAPPAPPARTYQVPADRGDGWPIAHAADAGVDTAGLTQLLESVDDNEYPSLDALVIVHQGRLILDENFRTETDQFDQEAGNVEISRHRLFSVSKSFVAVLVGIAIDEGLFAGVDIPYLPLFRYPSYENLDERKRAMTLQDTLTMRMGIEWDELSISYADPQNQLRQFLRDEHDWTKSLLDMPMSDEPGSRWSYNTIGSVTLGQAIEDSGAETLAAFLRSRLIEPLAVTTASWIETPTGLPHMGAGLVMSARDLARFGQMILDNGRWQNRQIVSEAWVRDMLTQHVEIGSANPGSWTLTGYGYQWWLGYFEHDGRRLDTYAARGYGQQNVLLIPELELVVVTFGNAYFRSAQEEIFQLVNERIISVMP